MAALVYGLFEEQAGADAATAELTRNAPEHPAFPVQVHTRAPLNGDDMPESATEIGRNTVIAIIVGGIVGLLLGVIAGATLDVMGLNVAIGAVFGLLTGVLSGMLGGMMAGTRTPKAALRNVAERLDGAKVLLTIEVGDPGHVDTVAGILDEHGAIERDHC
ncbi:MAG TPA: hypothetical protein VM869_28560 [Enhygromyxa sp.]|nr:hypothetical protein [Enhygromyxa sp.]